MWKGHRVIDVHGHISAPSESSEWRKTLSAGSDVKLRLSDDVVEAALHEPRGASNAHGHLQKLDDANIDFQLLGPRPVAMRHMDPLEFQHKFCEGTNDLLAQIVRLHPDRFAGMAQLPQHYEHDTTVCLDEFERSIKELNFVGAYVNPDPGGNRLTPGVDREYWFPLYEKAQELDVPLMIHPSHTLDPRVKIIPNNYQFNNLTEERLALELYTHSNVFDIFPHLKIVICHFGGALDRFIADDTAEGIAASAGRNFHLSRKGYGTNLFFDTCAYDDYFLEAAFRQKGVDACVFGTEAPGSGLAIRPDNRKDSDEYLVEQIGNIHFLSDADKLKVFQANPLMVFSRINRELATGKKSD